MSYAGGCLCAKVRYEVLAPPISQGICYCRQCRKAGGANGSPLLVLPEAALEILRVGLSACETKSDDGSTVRRNFCSSCGSHLFAEIADAPGIVTVRAATLDNFNVFTPEYLVWTEAAGPSCAFPPGVPSFSKDAPLELVLKN